MSARIAFFSPNEHKYSETFIHRQYKGLAGEKILFFGGYLPTHWKNDTTSPTPLLSEDWQPSLLKRLHDNNPVATRRAALQKNVLQTLKSLSPQVALAQYGPTGVEIMDLCEAAQIPLIVHFHGFDAYRDDTLGSYGKRYATLFQKAAALIVVSHDMEQQLIALGAPAEKVYRIPYGIDTDFFHPNPGVNRSPIFISVGRFVAKKGPLKTLSAFASAESYIPEFKLSIIGNGELENEVKSFIKLKGLEDRVELPGVLSPHAIRDRMQQAYGYVQHSLRTAENDSEGLPLSILEAAACELPILSTFHAGIPEAVIEKNTGLLVPPGNMEAMALQMIQLAQQPAQARAMGKAGRKHILSHFREAVYLNRINELIERVCK